MMQGDVRQQDCLHSIFRCYETKVSGKPVLTTMHCAYCGLNIQAASLEDCVAEWMKWKATLEDWEIPWADLDIDGAEDDGAFTTIISYKLAKELADYDIEKLQEKKRTDEINRMARAVCGILHHDCENCVDARYQGICAARKYSVRAYNLGYRKPEWISVEERLPEDVYGKDREQMTVLVYTKGKKVSQCSRCAEYKLIRREPLERDVWRRTGNFYWNKSKRVTHWMPLPEAPKMKGGAE